MKDTWASGALELFKHANAHINLNTAFDKRIAFISIDNCIETTMRTFLSMPSEKSGVSVSKSELEATNNSFPKLTDLLFLKIDKRLSDIDAYDIEFYHRIRNKIYHDGNGLSVDQGQLEAYKQIAKKLLWRLFKIEIPEEEHSIPPLGQLILLWNKIEEILRQAFAKSGVEMDGSKQETWIEAVNLGIAEFSIITDIKSLWEIRNAQAHAAPEKLDVHQIKIGISLAKNILKKLQSPPSLTEGLEIVFGQDQPFEEVQESFRAGYRWKTISVKVKNNTNKNLSNCRFYLIKNDYPDKEHALDKGEFSLFAKGNKFFKIASYEESKLSDGEAKKIINLNLAHGAFANEHSMLHADRSHLLTLRVKDIEEKLLFDAHCNLYVDPAGKLILNKS